MPEEQRKILQQLTDMYSQFGELQQKQAGYARDKAEVQSVNLNNENVKAENITSQHLVDIKV
ncbi:hypothetical protein [Pectobacterium jejuense]|uniref:hypothetical protein n=1 Tax=Pectobacterium TaxID=122277 RepID=UPI0022832A0D|nr:hypothetical protein [Pectobacterium jejuense]MCY9848890.1 hypothetical protein [Pectobacterium jejuense]